MSTTRCPGLYLAVEAEIKKLAKASNLFEAGPLAEATSDSGYVLRLNAHVFARRFQGDRIPKGMADAISKTGTLDARAELVALGRWLLVEKRPGSTTKRGRQPDWRTVLNTVGLAIHALYRADQRKAHQPSKKIGKSSRLRKITKNDLAELSQSVLASKLPASHFDANLRTLQHVLPAYLDHLRSKGVRLEGSLVLRSPCLEAIVEAITPVRSGPAASAPISAGPAVAPFSPKPFEIELSYSAEAEAEACRGAPPNSLPISKLCYVPETITARTKGHTSATKQPEGVILKPDLPIAENYRVVSVIDRVVILLTVERAIDRQKLRSVIEEKLLLSPFIHDRSEPAARKDWRASLPVLASGEQRGFHFAMMIQTPTPKQLRCLLDIVKNESGIDGEVVVHLVEVSVDFYPRNPKNSESSIILREKMVGVLQRHHWTPYREFGPEKRDVPRSVDARQLFTDHSGKTPQDKTRFLFSKGRDGFHSDSQLKQHAVRERILTDKVGEMLYLNATLSKGIKDSDVMVSIQHKVADQRNVAAKKMTVLPEHQRRARIEVTLAGRDMLDKRGLRAIDDLGKVSFRKLTSPYLSFRLPEVVPEKNAFEDAVRNMQSRGVYGIELRTRARAFEARSKAKKAGEKLSRKNDREGMGLAVWSEMNGIVGKALDGLTRSWKGFQLI